MSSTIIKTILIVLIFGFIIANKAYTPYVFGILLAVYVAYELFTLRKILSVSINGEFTITRQKSPIKLWLVILTILMVMTFLYVDKSDIYTPILLLTVVAIQGLKHFLYKSRKPTLLAIAGEDLLLNVGYRQRADLANLTRIGVYDISGDIECFFNDKSSMRIGGFKFYEKDLQELIEQMRGKSRFNVELTERAKIFINSR